MTSDLLLIGFSLLTWGLGEGAFFYFQPIYLQQLGADPVQIGFILGVAGVAMTVAHIPAGYLADRVGRKPLLVTAWCMGILSTSLMALATTLPVFVTGMVLYGITAFVVSPLNSYVTAARGKYSVGRAITLTSAMYNTGAIAGPLLGGFIGAQLGLRYIYFFSVGVFVLSTIVILFIHSQPREQHDPENPPVKLLANQRYLGFMVIAFISMFATYLPQPLTPNFLQNIRGISISQIGQIGAISSLGNVVLNLTLGQLDARIGFLLGQAAVTLFTLLIWRGTGFFWYALGYFLLGGFRVSRVLVTAQVRGLIHGAQMGLAYGVTETINTLPIIIAPPIAGLIYSINPEMIYPVSFVLICMSIFISWKFAPRNLAASGMPAIEDFSAPGVPD
jgi:DHA1 family multidrug resistance protein-like MFS transporter